MMCVPVVVLVLCLLVSPIEQIQAHEINGLPDPMTADFHRGYRPDCHGSHGDDVIGVNAGGGSAHLESSSSGDARQLNTREKRNAVAIQMWLWKDNKIPYVIDSSDFSTNAVSLITKAISQFNTDVTCIKFVPRATAFDYVRFKGGSGCHSSIGRDGGEQVLTLGPDCYYLGVIMHEMTHAVGFYHEQNRWDRDAYVIVNWNNIQPGKEHDFAIQEKKYLTTLGAPYDYGSLMHYGKFVFAKDGSQPAMTPIYDPHGELGQRDGFSKLDIWKINKLYGCERGPPPTPHWMTFLSSTSLPNTESTTSTTTTTATSLTTTPVSSSTTPITSSATTSPQAPGIAGKPRLLVTVFPNALRINWDRPPSTSPIIAYEITYGLEPNGRGHKVRVTPARLAYYMSTYTSHPGRRYTVSVAAVTADGVGPRSDPATVRAACTHAIYLDNSSYDKIHSPFFKNGYYENDVICAWRVRAPPGQRIKLTFHALSIDGTNGCDGDYVSVGEDRLYCNNPPANGYLLASGNDVNVTFVSKPGSRNIKPGGFNMSAAAEGHSPMNVQVTQLNTAFNISWEPPYAAQTIGYIVRYKLTSDAIAKDVMVSADRRHFVLSTWPHYGREFALDVLAVFPNYTSPPAGPYIERSKCSRNITVTGSQQHLNSPHYPQPYEPGTICEWNVTAHAGHNLVLTLDHVDLGAGDVVKITNSKFKLNIDSGYKPSLPIMTEDVLVKFVSDDAGEGAGFRLNIGVV